MDQKQLKQVKKYRILKVVFYSLGFPLFFFATLMASIKYIGRDPFNGSHLWEVPILNTQVFNHFQEGLSSPALYGLWVVAGIWLLVTIVHLIMTKVLKNPRSRMMVVVIVTVVALMGTMFGMDFAFDKSINAMIDELNSADSQYTTGVTVNDYKTQLAYYTRQTSDKEEIKCYYAQLIAQVERLEKVYAVNMFGYDKCGVAGDMGNTVAYYDELIDDEGNRPKDLITFKQNSDGEWIMALEADGNYDNDHLVVELAPNSKGQLEINGKTYSHYFYIEKTPLTSDPVYVWYCIDMYPNHEVQSKDGAITGLKRVLTDGAYGEGIYNPNGLFADGYIPSFYNVLEILEDYYAADEIVADIIQKYNSDVDFDSYMGDYDTWHEQVLLDAEARREQYYTDPDSGCSAFLQELYKSEMSLAPERFSLTRGRVDALLAEVGALLGDNGLFDLLFASDGLLADLLPAIYNQLRTGYDLGTLITDPATLNTVCSIISALTGKTCTGLVVTLQYVEDKGHFYLGVFNNVSDVATYNNPVLDLEFSNEVLGNAIVRDELGDPVLDAFGNPVINTEYAFDLDHLSALLSNGLTYLLNNAAILSGKTIYETLDGLLAGTVGTIVGLIDSSLTSADGLYAYLANLLDGLIGGSGALSYDKVTKTWSFDITALLLGLLNGLYYYQTPAIQTVYEFYVDESAPVWVQEAQKAMADKDRAYWTGAIYCPTIGSTIIGDELGGANDMNATYKYTSDFGLTTLAAVQQLKLDLSYMPIYYPLFTARDMILVFGGVVIMFYFLSFVAAQKEVEYANGTLIVGEKKKKKNKKGKKGAEEYPQTSTDEVAQNNSQQAAASDDVFEEAPNAPEEDNTFLDQIESNEEVG